MTKIDFYDRFYNSVFSDSKENFAIYTGTSNIKRKVDKKSNFISFSCDDEKSKKWLNELSKRYCFLYRNAPLIVSYMVKYLPKSFSDEVFNRLNFSFDDPAYYLSDDYLNPDYRNLTVLEILEDYILGYDTNYSYDLEKLVYILNKNNNHSLDKIKDEFDISKGNVGIGKFDICMKIILDTVYTFVSAQKKDSIILAQKSRYGYTFVGDSFKEKRRVYSEEIQLKFDTLERYYSILSYRNTRDNRSANLEKGMPCLKFSSISSERKVPIRFSLVGRNKLLEAFSYSPYGDHIRLDYTFKSDIYERLHDEIPWIHNAICNSLHDVENGCNTEFFPREDDIFYLDDKFKTICPCCGGLVTTGIMSRYHKKQIEDRVKKRSIDDPNLERKVTLLSELISLGGIDTNKEKIKRKGNI